MFCVVRCLEVVEGEWLAGLCVGCGWVPGGRVGSGWGPWVCVAGVGQGGLCVVKSGGELGLWVDSPIRHRSAILSRHLHLNPSQHLPRAYAGLLPHRDGTSEHYSCCSRGSDR